MGLDRTVLFRLATSERLERAQRLAAIARALPAGRRVQVGAKEAAHTVCRPGVRARRAARGLADRLGTTLQANLVRSPADADALAGAGSGFDVECAEFSPDGVFASYVLRAA